MQTPPTALSRTAQQNSDSRISLLMALGAITAESVLSLIGTGLLGWVAWGFFLRYDSRATIFRVA
jgi:hypothetical protein